MVYTHTGKHVQLLYLHNRKDINVILLGFKTKNLLKIIRYNFRHLRYFVKLLTNKYEYWEDVWSFSMTCNTCLSYGMIWCRDSRSPNAVPFQLFVQLFAQSEDSAQRHMVNGRVSLFQSALSQLSVWPIIALFSFLPFTYSYKIKLHFIIRDSTGIFQLFCGLNTEKYWCQLTFVSRIVRWWCIHAVFQKCTKFPLYIY